MERVRALESIHPIPLQSLEVRKLLSFPPSADRRRLD